MTRAWVGLVGVLTVLGCEAVGPMGSLSLPATDAPGVRLLEPAGCAVLTTPGPPVDLEVRFVVHDAAYPATTKGVAFLLDGGATPYAVVQSTGPVLVTGLKAGRHRLAACLVQKGTGDAWKAPEPTTCDVVTVDVALTGCSLTVADPITGDPECNPAAPAASCCIDQNPCSVETCDTSTGTPTCSFTSAAPDCCLSDVDCGAGQFCHQVDDPASAADDVLAVHRCASCALCGAGVACPDPCGTYPSCPAEDACGGGLCPLSPPEPEPEPEPDPDLSDVALAESEPAAETIEAALAEPAAAAEPDAGQAEAPGYTIDVTGEPDAVPPAEGGGSCALHGAGSAAGAFPLGTLLLGLALARIARRARYGMGTPRL